MLFGERLLSIRKAKKSSQEELAKAIGVHAPVIGRYERGEVKPSIEVRPSQKEIITNFLLRWPHLFLLSSAIYVYYRQVCGVSQNNIWLIIL
jgi:transcriptional regulator with XRE-family HTH domain